MFQVLKSSWALLLGMMLLMVGNGVQGTLLGIRGGIEGFSTFHMSIVMSGYFAGFLFGSRLTPLMIRRVGHVRVFAALGSFISAVLILYPAMTHPIAWTALRVVIGFCFSGVYVTAESWLNNAADNENRGKALSLYLIVQMVGIITAQYLLVLGDPGGFMLFILPSVLVSIAFAPILLSISPTPAFENTKGMSLRELFLLSPLGFVGIMVVGGVYAAMFGMSAVFGSEIGMSVGEISFFVSMFYIGGLVLQYPIGWISDRADRRRLILVVAGIAGVASFVPLFAGSSYYAFLVAAFFVGGMTNPLYALLLAYVNDYLDVDDMAAASAGLIFVNGIGAIMGPVVTGWIMSVLGPLGFFVYMGTLLLLLLGYGLWRSTRRAAPAMDDTSSYMTMSPAASPVAVDMAQEVWAEEANEGDMAQG
ncbi:putative MFS-type transporter YcaD [Aliiroseovarius sp. xm-m-379]|uniref:MFS transporter n=1 Tax=unclassified Aliiroseovarius TaxID=2623558 RepID=UPI001569D44D|nr:MULTISPECIES: MFS transporter [unclassified Aliiroseovarius]NRP12124.1 putative MFS-type transporter YcaD [Aliiroseovarius sp. xm-d-517]NRP25352.1 putative MFS-type transporter YcaD [Aliiroseovarius sp. xm-m-379]NRP30920.1 putative MFS-type transporter YcaD [Aliiroseovarius sp. xm-m-314]NRP34151.1 putative MFS-type transporter YcaD [Aliiroseovarius sp. xm-a-104]NRP41382.1 putative MFS-type transporter YcaD [Aliiroseovarius sp. xm-m-339-2]